MYMTDEHSIPHSSDKALQISSQSKRLNLLGQWKSQVTRGQTGLTQNCNVGVYSLYQAYLDHWHADGRTPENIIDDSEVCACSCISVAHIVL